jgi:hypothetical protein
MRRHQEEMMNIENKYKDFDDGSFWMDTYEISFKISDNGQVKKAILQASSNSEAIEMFNSLPQLRGIKTEIAEVKAVCGNVYFIN